MTETFPGNDYTPQVRIDPDAIASDLETLSESALCDSCRTAIVPVACDAVALLIEAIRLHEALTAARLESANRLAAIRAALHADADGESDPLAYLRDEVPADGGAVVPLMAFRDPYRQYRALFTARTPLLAARRNAAAADG